MDHHTKLETPPSRPLLITQRSVTRSGSVRSKGINFNTVSPTPGNRSKTHVPRTLPKELQASQLNFKESGSPTRDRTSLIDCPLPLQQELRTLSIDDQLRLLALKEMAVVAINDSINTLKMKLDSTQKDLLQLRSVIQKSLYKEVHRQNQKRPSGPSNSTRHGQVSHAPDLHDQNSTIWSNLSKPIGFLQHLDTLIQTEMEKSLGSPEPTKDQKRVHKTHKQHSQNPTDLLEEPLPVDIDKYLPPTQSSKYKDTDDMFQAVSSSLWSFVSEVKTNMISSLADHPQPYEEEDTDEHEDTINLIDMSDTSLAKDTEEEDKLDLSIYSSMRQQKN